MVTVLKSLKFSRLRPSATLETSSEEMGLDFLISLEKSLPHTFENISNSPVVSRVLLTRKVQPVIVADRSLSHAGTVLASGGTSKTHHEVGHHFDINGEDHLAFSLAKVFKLLPVDFVLVLGGGAHQDIIQHS